MKIKHLIIGGVAILGLIALPALAAVLNSNQVGTSPVAGSVLQTNGATSTWVATSSLGISGGGSSTITINGVSSTIFTLNSSTYLGITASGTAFTFTNLGVTSFNGATGTITFSAPSSTVNLTGSSTANEFPFWLDTNGDLSSSSNLFYAPLSGNVGIGATNPTKTLTLNSNSTSTGAQLQFGDSATSTVSSSIVMSDLANRTLTIEGPYSGSGAMITEGGTGSGFTIGTTGAGTIDLETSSTVQQCITNTGIVGIGDVNCTGGAKLYVVGSESIGNTAANARATPATGGLLVQGEIVEGTTTTSTSYSGVFMGGNFGIGTTTPAATLSVVGTQTVSQTSTFAGTVQINSNNLIDASGNKYVTSTSAGSVTSTYVAFGNSANQITSNASFTYQATSSRLTLGAATSSVFIGANSNFATTTVNATSVVNYPYTGATSSFVIPTGVTSITINAIGAGGGNPTVPGTASPGTGGSSTGTLAVTPGTTYYFCVGGSPAASTSGGPGGFCGGGTGAAKGGTTSDGGGGGGMTWFSSTSTFSTSTVLLVAGGGGGVSDANGSTIAYGGGTSGSAGQNGANGNGGSGGTQSAGGAAGTSGNGGGTNGSAGTGGTGGAAAGSGSGGGGGGGGYYGGGGGAGGATTFTGGGGGGGSGFASSTMTATSTATSTNSGNGMLTIIYNQGITSVFSTSSAALYIGGHILLGNQNAATSSVSSCGSSPVINGVDTAGSVFVGTGIVSSCTVNFGQPFNNNPPCTLGVYGTTVNAGIQAETTSSLTVGFSASLGGGEFNYFCPDTSE